jgi:SNF2 family DNA or RNA helicase
MCPASVLYNWIDELNTWGHFAIGWEAAFDSTPWIYVCFISKFHKNEKAKTLEELRKNKLDVVITTYETCREYIVSKLLVRFLMCKERSSCQIISGGNQSDRMEWCYCWRSS